MAEKKKKKGLLERATDYVTDLGVKYMTGRKRMDEPLPADKKPIPGTPPGGQPPMVNLPKPTGTRKKKDKKKGRGGVGGVVDAIKTRQERLDEASE